MFYITFYKMIIIIFIESFNNNNNSYNLKLATFFLQAHFKKSYCDTYQAEERR